MSELGKWFTSRARLCWGWDQKVPRIAALILASACFVRAQTGGPPGPGAPAPLAGTDSPRQLAPAPEASSAPLTITIEDAIERARTNDAQFLSAVTALKLAREDHLQARAALLPSVSSSTQYLGTQGNGILPSGRYVTNDGVHVYRAWGVFHQDFSPGSLLRQGYRRASAQEALARAQAEVARRGLSVTVTKEYYALLVSQRKYATAQQSLVQARHFLDMTQAGERVGQIARSDVVKAEIQFAQQKQSFEEARLAMETDRLALAVLLFPTLNENFTLVDDLDAPRNLPPFPEIQAMAEKQNPSLRAAIQAARAASLDVGAARNAFLPSLVVDVDYGIEANSFALRSRASVDPRLGRLPNPGYFITAALSIPVWDWGTLRSKLRQAQYRRQQANVELSQAGREAMGNLLAFYNEASVARTAVESARQAADLASESQRLVNLRYQAGESTALEVVDAQNTLTQARNAYDDAQARYRMALANLQSLTGSF